MSIISSYKIEGDDLYFEESLYWAFTADQQDAIQVWKLTNVDKGDLDKIKLNQLISYDEDIDYEQEIIGNRTRLKITTYLDNGDYVFNCDKITFDKRPYNSKELTDFILKYEQLYQNQDKTVVKQRQFINELRTFIYKEMDRKDRIMEQITDSTNNAKIKAEHQLEILKQIKYFFDNNSLD